MGRALRNADHKDKKLGYIVVPVYHRKSESVEEMVENSAFKNLVKVIRAMCNHDESIIDEITQLKLSKGKRLAQRGCIELVNIATHISEMDADEFREKIFTEVLNRVPVQWRRFEDAREFAHGIGLGSKTQWEEYTKSAKKPQNIPTSPHSVYKNEWNSWSDWLGIPDRKNIIWRSFKEARLYSRSLGFQNCQEWNEYAKSDRKTIDIPATPNQIYKDNGWESWSDWLGNDNRRNVNWRKFIEARKFVHSLKLNNGIEWREFANSDSLPRDIPKHPESTYKAKGWISLADWLGIPEFWSFYAAKEFVQKLQLQSQSEWREYCNSGQKPSYIPASPSGVYANGGWICWNDFLGTGRKSSKLIKYQNFEKARDFALKLGLKSEAEWKKYCKSGNKPCDIPINPDQFYRKSKEWISWFHFLGAGVNRNFKPFLEAKEFVRELKFKTRTEWNQYCRSNAKPYDIPSVPSSTYKNDGWISMSDCLGVDITANYHKIFRSFKSARNFVIKLGIKSKNEWSIYCKSGNKPNDIPADPSKSYKNKGWVSWGNWLGTAS